MLRPWLLRGREGAMKRRVGVGVGRHKASAWKSLVRRCFAY
jgi:hypothetical protein